MEVDMSDAAAAPRSCTAFAGYARIATGSLNEVALATKRIVDQGESLPILVFDNATSLPVEIDFRGTAEEVAQRLSSRFPGTEVPSTEAAGTTDSLAPPESTESPRRAGRPKLGVVGREVTLLPRHWDWLAAQPGGASVVIRKLVDKERKASEFKDLARKNQETVYRFIHAVGGNLAGFEEVSRALFAGNRDAFRHLTEAWPVDVRDHARWLMLGGPDAIEGVQ
jgi:hypothetical protein